MSSTFVYKNQNYDNSSISSSCGTFTTASTSYVDVIHLSYSFKTTGNKVLCQLVPDPGSTFGGMIELVNTAGNRLGYAICYRDSTSLGEISR